MVQDLTGTRKKKRCVRQGNAQCFEQNEADCTSETYVYQICIYNADACDRMDKTRSLGILTKRIIDPIECFPIFAEDRYFAVKIHQITDTIINLTVDDIERVREFHTYLFTHVLNLEKNNYVYTGNKEKITAFSIVPLLKSESNGTFDIDWELINRGFTLEKSDEISIGDVVWSDCKLKSKFYVVTENVGNANSDLNCSQNEVFKCKEIQCNLGYFIPRSTYKCSEEKAFIILGKMLQKYSIPYDLLKWFYALPIICHRMNLLCLAFSYAKKIAINLNLNLPVEITDTFEFSPIFLGKDFINDKSIEVKDRFDNFIDLSSLHISEQTSSQIAVKDFTLQRLKTLENAPRLTILNRNNRTSPKSSDILRAFTSTSCQDLFNNDNLEILGDCFLKFAISVSLFNTHPDFRQGKLTLLKAQFLSNQNLFYAGKNYGINGCIQTNRFNPYTWCPPSFSVPKLITDTVISQRCSLDSLDKCNIPDDERQSGVLKRKTMLDIKKTLKDFRNKFNIDVSYMRKEPTYINMCIVPDKVVADTVEALLGLYLIKCGIKIAYNLLLELRIISGSLYSYDAVFDYSMNVEYDESLYLQSKDIEIVLNHTFTNKRLLLIALNHSTREGLENFQRFEFLGDALLDFVITSYIIEYYNDATCGIITDLRSALVNNYVFAYITVRLGLHKWLIATHLNPQLKEDVLQFVEFVENNPHSVGGIANISKDIDNSSSMVQKPPKVLSDIFESLATAIYLDTGFNLNYLWGLYYNLMKEEIEKCMINIPIDPVRLVNERIGACDFSIEKVHDNFICSAFVTGHNGKVSVYRGEGKNSIVAKKAAATAVLRSFETETTKTT